MVDLAGRRRALAAARAEFLEGGDADLRVVPDHVAASWRRSASSGVAPSGLASEYHADLDLASRLVRCARPVIERLVGEISGLPMSVALTDNRARLLARRDTTAPIGRVLDGVYFAEGFGYTEGAVGTNGVGTVLEFGESVHIVGAEHFVDTLQSFACAGAPIRDPFTGRIEGVLDISCRTEHSTPIMHSLVRSAAAQVERNLLADRNQLQQVLFDAYARVDARGRDAVLAVGPRVVMANPTMQTLLGGGDQDALHDHVRFLMLRRTTVDEYLDLPSGERVRLRGTTVGLGDDVAGVVGVVALVRDDEGRPRPVRRGAAPRSGRLVWGSCPAWRAAAAAVEAALAADHPVLVLGEPGTGRCTLLTELHGAATGATATPIDRGAVEADPGGTAELLIGAGPDLPVLRDVDRLSDDAVDALVAALTGAPARFAATATDLPHRLLPLFRASATVPPLRHRSVDLPAMVTAVLADLAPHRDVRLSADALRLLGRHRWPGNVRELADALGHALRRRPVGCIGPEDLPAYCQSVPRNALREVDRVERDAIVAALRDAGGNRVAAAAALGVARSTLYRKIRQYGITA